MPTKRLTLILSVALICAILASVLVVKYVRNREEEARRTRMETQPVVVAKSDIPVGARLDATVMVVRDWPKSGAPQGAVSEPGALLGRIVKTEITRDEPILEHRLLPKDVTGTPGVMSIIVPPGKRAITVGVNEVIGVSGFITPQDRVDVIAIRAIAGASGSAETIVQNAEVLAAGKRLEQGSSQPLEVPTITLAVNPWEAERIALALQQGKIHVVLRPIIDAPAVGSTTLSRIQQAMKEIAPHEEIRVKGAQDSVVISGTVSNASILARAAEVAKAFLPEKATVVNLLRLSEPHQIMLKVEIAEVNRTALREIGLDFINLGTTFAVAVFGGTTAGILNTTLDTDGTTLFDSRTSALIRQGNTRTLLRALEQKGFAKSLARPNLIATSGADATFLVGGEFPFPVIQGGAAGTAASVTIEFKPFGVRLDFTPTLNDLGSINLKIAPEVSALDFVNAVTVSGTTVPSLTKRRARTIVDLKPGQSLAIGGLIQIDDRKILTKFPIMGDIPVLGALFRSTNFTRNETDLIIFVTPEVVKPLASGQTPNLEEQMTTTPEEEKEFRQIPGR